MRFPFLSVFCKMWHVPKMYSEFTALAVVWPVFIGLHFRTLDFFAFHTKYIFVQCSEKKMENILTIIRTLAGDRSLEIITAHLGILINTYHSIAVFRALCILLLLNWFDTRILACSRFAIFEFHCFDAFITISIVHAGWEIRNKKYWQKSHVKLNFVQSQAHENGIQNTMTSQRNSWNLINGFNSINHSWKSNTTKIPWKTNSMNGFENYFYSCFNGNYSNSH